MLNAVAISDGPGSYTGLRVGASVAKGLCYALDIPLIAVSTLQSLAAGVSALFPSHHLMPCIDARRMEVYTAIYDSGLTLVKKPDNLIVNVDVLKKLSLAYAPLVIMGNGAAKLTGYSAEIPNLQISPSACNAADMCALAYTNWSNKHWSDLVTYTPNYLKSPNITIPKKIF